MSEIWKHVPELPDYVVSNTGKVKSLNYRRTGKEKVLSITKHSNTKYLRVCIGPFKTRQYWLLHRLIYHCFNPEQDITNLQIDHIDCNPLNNNILNLRAVTQSENMLNPITREHQRFILRQRYIDNPQLRIESSIRAKISRTEDVRQKISVANKGRHRVYDNPEHTSYHYER